MAKRAFDTRNPHPQRSGGFDPLPAPAPSLTTEDARVIDVPLEELQDSPFQVKQYDDARVKDLAETIRRQGLLQPATVRFLDGRYQLISGHARRAALRYLRDKVAATDAERAGYANLRCLLLSGIDDARAAALTAIENLQRDDGTPLEQALMVARARDAGHYQNIPETALALGLPLGRVRQYLLLADAPTILQRAVSPGVMVAREDGRRERMVLPVTSVLAVRPYYDFLFESRLAELKGVAAAQRRREERQGRLDDSLERKQRNTARQLDAAAEFAADRTDRLLSRAARHLWTVAQLQARVRSATRPDQTPVDATPVDDGAIGETAPAEAVPRPHRLYLARGGRLTIWPPAISGAGATERAWLADKLRTLLHELET